MLSDVLEIITRRKNAMRPDQSSNLENKREEGRKVNETKSAQKQPPWNEAIGSAAMGRKQPAHGGLSSPTHAASIEGE
jgi:hypothetical protein